MYKFNKFSSLLVLLASISCLLLNGCASIVHGTRQTETFNTVPAGANITIDGKSHGVSPVTAALKRDQTHTIDVNLPGYQPAQFKLERGISGWYFGNFIFGGIIGLVVDAADGAIYKISPSELTNISDDEIKASSDENITIVLVKEVPKSMKKNKVAQLKKAN